MTDAAKTYRSRLGMLIAAVIWVGCVGILAAQAVTAGALGVASSAPATALVAYLAWLAMWSPSVSVSPRGLVVRNILRSTDLPWWTVTDVGLSSMLTITTAHGRTVAWAAPAPPGGGARWVRGGAYSRTRSDSGDVALIVLGRWREVERMPPPAPAAGEPGVVVRWLVPQIVVAGALLVLTVAVSIVTH